MFEDSTFESTGKIKTRSRRWMLLTLAVNGTILAILVLLPLIYPGALPSHIIPTQLVAPEAPKPEVRPEPVRVRTATPHDFPEFDNGRITAPPSIPTTIRMLDKPEEPFANSVGSDLAASTPGGGNNPFGGEHAAIVVHPPVPSTIHLSSKLVEGFVVYKSIPPYPAIAKATHTEGTVVLQAMISKAGTIEGLHVISGPAMLQQAALDSVKNWRYKPYLLNGQTVEVETTVNVIFKLER